MQLIEAIKAPIRRRWPHLRLRTILLATFIFIAALPGVGALFLRVYENTLVRQTEAELIAQGAALAAVASADWPGSHGPSATPSREPEGVAGGELSTIDLRTTPVRPERPASAPAGPPAPDAQAAARAIDPILRATAQTSLASILLLDAQGRILTGPEAGRAYTNLDEVTAARAGHAITTLRRNGDYQAHYRLEWLSRASDLRIHHARPVIVNGRVVGVLLLSRSPRALFRGLYEDRGKILLGIGLILIVLIGLSGLLSRGIARPIEALSDATRKVARGGSATLDPPTTAAIEIQALYADFALMAEAIDRRSRYLRDFAHAVSHEFKTPLAAIRGTIEILEDHHATMGEAERRHFLANIHADSERLSLLVSRLLELARADMATADAQAATGLRSALTRIADAQASDTFRIALPEETQQVAMPAPMLEAILTSLIENARQAGAACVTISAAQEGNEIRLTLADNGPGIPLADRTRIFEPFFTSRREAGGTGLGLAIARSLLSSHGGSIALDDTETGTAFTITLPAAAPT